MRRLLVRAIALILLAVAAGPSLPAVAQEPAAEASLRLVSQSAWNSPNRPLQLSVQATGDSTRTLESLTVVLSIFSPARSRSVYDLSLGADATSSFFAVPFAQGGRLAPGQTRTFRLRQQLDVLTARRESAVYPVKVQLLSEDSVVGTLRTPLVFLIEHPEVPLNLNTTWVLWEPIQHDAHGVFRFGSLEADIAPGGRIARMADALEAQGPLPTDVVVSTALIDQLRRMAGGYRFLQKDGTIASVARGAAGSRDAARVLGDLRLVAARPQTELSALPLGDASVPALLQARLAKDIPTLLARGAELVTGTLGVSPTPSVVRPLFSQLNAGALSRLNLLGASSVLLDPSFLPVPAGQKFSPSPLVQLSAGPRSVVGVLPDAGVAAVAAENRDDPVLGAHAALGELAAIWLEFPGTPRRGAAVLFPERVGYPGEFFSQFWRLVARSPWLRPRSVAGLRSVLPDPERRPAPSRPYPSFEPTYLFRLFGARAALARFTETAGQGTALVEQLQDRILQAEASTFLSQPLLGREYLDSVQAAITTMYSRVAITSSVVTLTSRKGFIPVTITNDAGFPMHAVLNLVADRRLSFANGAARSVVLDTVQRTYAIPVRAETTGRFPIKVQLLTPVGGAIPDTIAETEVVVRSTAYNRLALFVTVGAGFFLLLWWGRRFLPHPKRRRASPR